MLFVRTKPTLLQNKLHIFQMQQEDEMGRTCSIYGREAKAHRTLMGKPWGKRSFWRLERTQRILKRLLKKQDEGMDWIHLAQERCKDGAVSNTVMNIRVPLMRVSSWRSSQEGFCSTEFTTCHYKRRMIWQLAINNLDTTWKWPWTNLRYCFEFICKEWYKHSQQAVSRHRFEPRTSRGTGVLLTLPWYSALSCCCHAGTYTNEVKLLILLLLVSVIEIKYNSGT